MYSTCLFCHRNLGANDLIESFPVGRRLAFDSAKGRLWVVCRHCERWNLTPLEERWEAIEVAERLYRSTLVRLSSDNIGLARANGGLDLVRIGTPGARELAAWRYGSEFGRRRLWHGVAAGTARVAGAAHFLGLLAGVGLTAVLPFAYALAIMGLDRRRERSLTIRGDDGALRALFAERLSSTEIVRQGDEGEWALDVTHWPVSGRRYRSNLGSRVLLQPIVHAARLTGERATNALRVMMPFVNTVGGNARAVNDAVRFLEQDAKDDPLFNTVFAVRNQRLGSAAFPLGDVPQIRRLALEMAMNDNVERRAMQGELALLERIWRDAEEIAAIADALPGS